MKRHLGNQPVKYGCEPLESRLCLTVAVAVDDTNLAITGDADGVVDIAAASDGSITVTDNGVVVDTVSGITGTIRVDLDEDGTADNTVTMNLNTQAVDRVIVELGGGVNSFSLTGGTVNRDLIYRGGSDDDHVTVGADATVESERFPAARRRRQHRNGRRDNRPWTCRLRPRWERHRLVGGQRPGRTQCGLVPGQRRQPNRRRRNDQRRHVHPYRHGQRHGRSDGWSGNRPLGHGEFGRR